MTKLSLTGVFLLAGVFTRVLLAQEPGVIVGKVLRRSSGAGIPEVAIALCPDTGRQAVSVTHESTPLPPRNQVQEIRIPPPGDPGPIAITTVSDDCPNAQRATTDNMGRFVFSGLEPGSYKVHARRNGYISELLRGIAVVSQPVNVAAGKAVPEISFSLIKGGVITGTVRDPNGQPAPLVTVSVVSARGDVAGPPVSVQSDDHGYYRLFWLPPGEFVVKAETSDRSATIKYGSTYYRNSREYADATPVSLREGEEVPGIDLVLTPPQ